MPRNKGSGYTPGEGATDTGRRAVPRLDEIGKGRATPQTKEMPFARHIDIHIIVGIDPATGDDPSVGAKDNAIEAWKDWIKEADQRHITVLELRFEFIQEDKMVLYVIYSQ